MSFDSQQPLPCHSGSSSVSRTICLNYLLPLTSSLGFMDKISHPEQFAEAVLQSMGLAYPQRDALCWADEDVRLRVAEQLEQGIRHCILSSNPMTFERCHFSVSYSQLALDKAFMSLKNTASSGKRKRRIQVLCACIGKKSHALPPLVFAGCAHQPLHRAFFFFRNCLLQVTCYSTQLC